MNENINNSINFTLINYKNIMSGGSNNEILLPSENDYTLYIKKECPYCIEILELVEKKFPEYEKVIINKGDKYKKNNKNDNEKLYIIDVLKNGYNIDEFKKKINEYNKKNEYNDHYTFPILYKNGALQGGLDDFKKLLHNKEGGYIKKNKIYKIIKL